MSALEEYRDYARHSEVGHNYATPSGLRKRADAAIAELEAALEDAQIVAFVRGAQWWEFEKTGATMWQSDRNKAEVVARARFLARHDAGGEG